MQPQWISVNNEINKFGQLVLSLYQLFDILGDYNFAHQVENFVSDILIVGLYNRTIFDTEEWFVEYDDVKIDTVKAEISKLAIKIVKLNKKEIIGRLTAITLFHKEFYETGNLDSIEVMITNLDDTELLSSLFLGLDNNQTQVYVSLM